MAPYQQTHETGDQRDVERQRIGCEQGKIEAARMGEKGRGCGEDHQTEEIDAGRFFEDRHDGAACHKRQRQRGGEAERPAARAGEAVAARPVGHRRREGDRRDPRYRHVLRAHVPWPGAIIGRP